MSDYAKGRADAFADAAAMIERVIEETTDPDFRATLASMVFALTLKPSKALAQQPQAASEWGDGKAEVPRLNQAEIDSLLSMIPERYSGSGSVVSEEVSKPVLNLLNKPKRECATCWHERSSALMVSEPCRSCVDYNNHEPKESA